MPSLDAARLARALNAYGSDLEPLAAFLHRYFTNLCNEGFTRREAVYLTRELEASLLRIIAKE